ncbi:hypothetical protein IKF40_01320 [Candidatus Saccharibacteria bacterium]|nr:hypothetical protein [Candidatus Saccharibacteria bacterium]
MDPSKPSNEPAPEMPTKTEAETSAPTETPTTPTEMPTETEAPKETSTETEIATSPQPITPTKPTDKKKIIALVVVLVLIVATLATVLIVQNLNNRSTKSTNTAPQTSSDETIDDSEDNCEDSNSDDCRTSESSSEQSSSEVVTKDTKEEVKSLMETFKSAAESAAVNTFGQSIDLSITYYDNGGVSYKFDGAKVATPTTGVYLLSTANTSNSDTPIVETMDRAITAKAKELGFIEYTEVIYNLMERPAYYLPSSQIICTGIDIGTLYSIEIGCASTSWHTQESIDLANQLADAYYAKVGNYPYSVNATSPKIENSPYHPYQRMETATLGAALLFYRTSPDATWQFFKATQAALSCDEFNTPDLRRAFAGTTCVTNGYQQATVTAD